MSPFSEELSSLRQEARRSETMASATTIQTDEAQESTQTCRPECAVTPVIANCNPVYLVIKRSFDILAALAAGILLILPMCVIALLIKLDSKGPVIFKQERMGTGGKPFTMYKFRSMRMDAPSELATREFTDLDKYLTRLGKFLRCTSLDELPQLINILNGTMSFVGYRPVCLTEVELNQLRKDYGVFAARPGLTGLAQVSGRDNLEFEEKAKLDAQYVQNRSIKMDLWCLFRTVVVVITGEGIL
jgi:O-antigen biosynthesis protein WbqP